MSDLTHDHVALTPSWLPTYLLPGGRLGLVHSPGSGGATRDQELGDLAGLGVHHIICLQESCELLHYRQPETMDERRVAVEQLGIAFTHSPIVDQAAAGLEQARELVGLIDRCLREGQTVIVHCWAGLGRAGTLAACYLRSRGMGPVSAVSEVRAARPGAIESEAQRKFIGNFSTHV